MTRARVNPKLDGCPVEELEIFFDDFTLKAQAELLIAHSAKSAKDMNWDTYPVTTLAVEPIEEEENECMQDEPGEHEGPDIRD